jgi:hypothetical protein
MLCHLQCLRSEQELIYSMDFIRLPQLNYKSIPRNTIIAVIGPRHSVLFCFFFLDFSGISGTCTGLRVPPIVCL